MVLFFIFYTMEPNIYKSLESSDNTIKCAGISEEYRELSPYPTTLFTFQDALNYEKNMQPLANHFYKDVLGAINIKRYDWNDPNGKFMQKLDVDCSIQLETESLDVFWLNISEKFRQVECGDMCLELWSDFEKEKLGWAGGTITTDYYLYTTPKYFFEVYANEKFKQLMRKIQTEITREVISDAFKSKNSYSKIITIDGHEMTLIKTWTGNSYYGICICISWTTLFNDYLLDINMYSHGGEKLDINKIYA